MFPAPGNKVRLVQTLLQSERCRDYKPGWCPCPSGNSNTNNEDRIAGVRCLCSLFVHYVTLYYCTQETWYVSAPLCLLSSPIRLVCLIGRVQWLCRYCDFSISSVCRLLTELTLTSNAILISHLQQQLLDEAWSEGCRRVIRCVHLQMNASCCGMQCRIDKCISSQSRQTSVQAP